MVEEGFYIHSKKGRRYIVLGEGSFSDDFDNAFLIGLAHYSEGPDQKVEVYRTESGIVLRPTSENTEMARDVGYVVYQALYDSDDFGRKAMWARPKSMFIGNVVLDGKEVPRFKLIFPFSNGQRNGL